MTSPPNPLFWETVDRLVASSEVIIDRPKGSVHPRLPDYVFPLDYGYLDGTTSGDGQGIDVWMGSSPGTGVTAVICAVDLTKRDAEVKILINCTAADIDIIYRDHNFEKRAGVLITRYARENEK